MRYAPFLFFSLLLAGCATTANDRAEPARAHTVAETKLTICSGYGCKFTDRFAPDAGDRSRLKAIMAQGATSPAAERRAIRRAIAQMERAAQRQLRFGTDAPLSLQRHANRRGQMDCFDESTNTRTYLRWLDRADLMRHHKQLRKIAQRGYLIDGRYPHKTALIRDTAGGVWAVDSWRGRNGQPPEIMPISRWENSSSSDFAYDPSI
ncbi:hypothetical protein [Notoacmeibacter marinus]|uniref:hypothetical protein n=1 Tax=Notoacmeibacter marinus TaxID=1876515 RepID=UPI000DF2467E|nr:hypothetical protein [Notoacmeibacter marinus]